MVTVKDEGGKHEDAQNSENNSTENVTQAAARGTLSTLVLRLISFVCTQLTIRALDPSTLGTNIQLELLLTTILFISREGFRLALTQNVVPETWTVGFGMNPSNMLHIVPLFLSIFSILILYVISCF